MNATSAAGFVSLRNSILMNNRKHTHPLIITSVAGALSLVLAAPLQAQTQSDVAAGEPDAGTAAGGRSIDSADRSAHPNHASPLTLPPMRTFMATKAARSSLQASAAAAVVGDIPPRTC